LIFISNAMSNKIQVTTTFSRKSERYKFYLMPESFREHIETKYLETGKILSRDSYVSVDRMAKTIVTQFASIEDWQEFNADPIQLQVLEDRITVCKENNIKISVVIQEYNNDGIVNSTTRTII